MSENFDQVEIRKLFDIVKESICPFLFPDEEFVHHSLPAFDSTGCPVVEFGRQIESNKTLLAEPAVLLSKLNPRTSRVSLADPINDKHRHCCSTEFIAYRAKEEGISNIFYKYFFQTDKFRIRLQNVAIGTTNSHVRVTPSETLDWKVPCPSKAEQTKITEILLTVDQAIEQTEALIVKQRRIKTGLMQDLLTRGIDEHGNLRSEETHEFKDSPLGRIPVDWEVKPAIELCDAVIDCKNRTPPPANEGHPVIRTPNVRNGEFMYADLDYTDSTSYEVWVARGKPRAGDVIITREAPFGEACLIPDDLHAPCLGQRIMMYQPNPAKLRPDYLVFAIYSEAIQKKLLELAGGSTVGHIRVGDIRKLPIPHPTSIDEQKTIAGALTEAAESIRKLKLQGQKLHLLKTGLMQDLLTGQKRVTALLTDKEEVNL